MIALGIGFLVPIGYSTKHYMIRKYSGGYHPFDLTVDSSMLEASLNCGFTVYWYLTKGADTMTWELIGWGSLSGFLIHCANNLMACGVVNGYGGPCQALMSTSSLWATIMTAFYENKPLSDYQTAALASGFSGICIIAAGDMIKDKLISLCKKIIILRPG